MSKPLYLVHDRDLLTSLAAFQGGFHTPEVVLEGLTEEQAIAKPHGLPHSIADIVSHLCYWQDYFNQAASEGFPGFPEHATEGWPSMRPGEWNFLRKRFLEAVETTQRLANSCDTLEEKLVPASFPLPFWERESIGSGLVHAAMHGSHHLGQVVTIRQIMGLWPPSAGSLTW